MEFNDGNQYHPLLNVDAYRQAGREIYMYRGASARNGVPYVDTSFDAHRKMSAIMPATVIYQFVWQAAGTPESQANFFLSLLGNGLQQQEMVMLDIEAGGGIANPVDFARRWLAVVEGALQTRAWVYVPSTLASALSRSVTAERVVMAPRYSGGPHKGLEPWWPYDVWQYSSAGFFPGCADVGDVSWTPLTTIELLTRCNPTGFPEPPHGGPHA